jgi:GNAT superfamily N-acetyltransferase
MLRVATIEDLDLAVSLAMKFAANSPYKDMVDEATIRSLATEMITSKNYAVVLLHDEDGFLAARVAPFPFARFFVAQEFAWWVNPEKRGQGIGKELREAFEEWGRKIGCKAVVITTLDPECGKDLEAEGFKPYEYAYMKEM